MSKSWRWTLQVLTVIGKLFITLFKWRRFYAAQIWRAARLPFCKLWTWEMTTWLENKKLSYRRETARQLPAWRGLGPPASSRPPPPLATPMRMVESESHNVCTSSVPYTKVTKRTFKINRAFKVIQGHPFWCRQASRTVCWRNAQLIPRLFMKLTKIRQRENGKCVDFNDPTQVWRRPSKKRLQISTNDL